MDSRRPEKFEMRRQDRPATDAHGRPLKSPGRPLKSSDGVKFISETFMFLSICARGMSNILGIFSCSKSWFDGYIFKNLHRLPASLLI